MRGLLLQSISLLGIFVLSVQLVALQAAAAAAEGDFKATFPRHWQMAKEFTLAVAEAMPAEGYDFKPDPEEMSFGSLMIHVADDNSGMCARVAGTKPLASPAGTDKQTAIRFLTESFDKCFKEIDGLTAQQWEREVYKFQGRPVFAQEALLYSFTHTAHHRAQAEVYLRVKKIRPPQWRF